MDLEIREFSNSIVNYINSAPLPIEVKRLVLHDICQKVDAAADGVIKGQIAEREQRGKEVKERPREPQETEEDMDDYTTVELNFNTQEQFDEALGKGKIPVGAMIHFLESGGCTVRYTEKFSEGVSANEQGVHTD